MTRAPDQSTKYEIWNQTVILQDIEQSPNILNWQILSSNFDFLIVKIMPKYMTQPANEILWLMFFKHLLLL